MAIFSGKSKLVISSESVRSAMSSKSREMALNNKRVLLTGGSGGLGQLVAGELLEKGAKVTSLSRSAPASLDTRVRHIATDLSDRAGIAAAAETAAREQPDILINMAGVQHFGPADAQSSDDVHAGYLVNLVAPAALCGACLPAMKRRNAGQIINIGSIFGSIPSAYFAAYSSAKSGLRAYSEALRRELAGSALCVTYIAPRAVRTGMINAALLKYATLTRMRIDPPEQIARRIVTAISKREKDVYIGFPERLFVTVNAVLPRLVDAAVTRTNRTATNLFAQQN
jgi:short-subunit dehydrogenase